MHVGQKQVVAEKIASTVRILELLGLDYEVTGPRHIRTKGNKSPRVVTAHLPRDKKVRIYNGIEGHTWAYIDEGGGAPAGRPIPGIGSVETLYLYLKKRLKK